MKRFFKRTISTILTVVLVFTAVQLSGFVGVFFIQSEAAIEYISGVYTYIVENGTATITKCNDTTIEIALIPSSFDDNVVTKIGRYAFEGCTNLIGIDIPEGILSIEDAAFESCKALTEIVIPDSVVDLGMGIFKDCVSLTNIKFGKGITEISYRMFEGCTSLTYIEIPDTVTCLSDRVFRDCVNLESVKIPASVKTMGYLNFEYCYKLKDVYYEGSEKQWNQIDFESYYEDFSNATIHYYYRGDIKNVTYQTVEDTHKAFTVTAKGRQSMIQFIEPDGGTRTYDRYNKNVTIMSYNADGEVVSSMARELAYEVWEIYSNMSVGVEIKVRGKENGKWDEAKHTFIIKPYNPVISMELSETSGNKGPVPTTVVADAKTEKVMFKMQNNTSVTISDFTVDENDNRVFTGKAWMNEDGINEIKIYINRDNSWKLVGTLEYTVE